MISDRAKGEALIGFLRWGLTRGQDYLEALSYARLPNELVVREQKAIASNKSHRYGSTVGKELVIADDCA